MIWSILIFLGLCTGSFVNAFAWRIHKGKNWINGRSECPKCHHQLRAVELVPVFSWVLLKGKCRYCNKPISIQYPLVEFITAGLFIGSYYYWPFGFYGIGVFQFIIWLVLLVGFMALIIFDLSWMILPNKVIYPLILVAIVSIIIKAIWTKDFIPVIDSLWGIIVLAGLFYVLFQVSKGSWIGGGDVKLGILLGILVGGPVNSIFVLYFASILGSLYAFMLVIKRKTKWRQSRIAFGPFLIIAGIVVYIFGQHFNNWVLNYHF